MAQVDYKVLIFLLMLITCVSILLFQARRKKNKYTVPKYPMLDNNKYELFNDLYVQQVISKVESSPFFLELQLRNSRNQVLSCSKLEIYGGTWSFEPIQTSPDKKLFAVFTTGNTGYEETIDYCAVYKVEHNKILCLYSEYREGGSKYRWRNQAIVIFEGQDRFQVNWKAWEWER